MQGELNLILGILALFLSFPIGLYLKKLTLDENKQGQIWFKTLVIASLLGAFVSIFLKNDALLFTFLFFAITTGMSLKKN
ncbi:MAG: hypothetical protein AABX93_02965 [Nanoarchaeota archaeon]